jgi:hypothetical protein
MLAMTTYRYSLLIVHMSSTGVVHWRTRWSITPRDQMPTSLCETLDAVNPVLCPSIDTILCIMLTMPVTSATKWCVSEVFSWVYWIHKQHIDFMILLDRIYLELPKICYSCLSTNELLHNCGPLIQVTACAGLVILCNIELTLLGTFNFNIYMHVHLH